MTTTIAQKNAQIINVLCTPARLGQAVTASGILTVLEAKYPTTGWTLDTLNTQLTSGRATGLFVKVGDSVDPTEIGWTINRQMLFLNSANGVYAPFGTPLCSQVYTVPGVYGTTSYE